VERNRRAMQYQRWMPGDLWWDVEGDLTPEEHDDLWRQFGRLVKAISSVLGEAFGLVQAGEPFPTWSLALLEWLERTIADADHSCLDTALLCRLLAIVRDHTGFLDEMARPRRLARGFVVVQPADRAQARWRAHRGGAGCRPWLVGRSSGGLDLLLAATPCLPAGTGALLAGLWATGSRARVAVQSAGLSRAAPGQNPVGRQARRQRASTQEGLSRPGGRGEHAPVRTHAALAIPLGRWLDERRELSWDTRDRRRLTVTITAYPRSINQPHAAWTATASQPTCRGVEQQHW
jgi:hypothetical protein